MAPDYLWLAQLNSNKIILLLRMTRGMRAQLATGLVFFIEIHQKSASRKALSKTNTTAQNMGQHNRFLFR